LFTQEIVETGAILPKFQDVALTADRTALVETSPGHVIRCAPTGFVDEFAREQRRMTKADCPTDEIRTTLENLTVGRLRIASKGVVRAPSSKGNGSERKFVSVGEAEQLRDGMYMIGQVAALRESRCTIAELHENVCVESKRHLQAFESPHISITERSEPVPPQLDVAIVGMSCMLPG